MSSSQPAQARTAGEEDTNEDGANTEKGGSGRLDPE